MIRLIAADRQCRLNFPCRVNRVQNVAGGILALTLVVLFFSFSNAAEPEKNKPSAPRKESAIDKQLRDSLDDDLLKDLPVSPKKKAPADSSTPPADKKNEDASLGKPKSALDAKLLDQLGEGEDVDLRKPTDPLTQIGQRMRQVEGLIGQRDTSRNTQEMQRQIATDLDTLIKELQSQQNKSAGSKAGKSGQQSDTSGAGNNKPTPRPSSESTQRVEKSTVKTDNSAELQKMIKEVWGHLPARVREQMQNVADEQFLPQYEKMIEEYYRRLAEQGAKSP